MTRPVEPVASSAARDVSLGYLRASIVLLVIAHHVATAYAPLLPRPFTGFPDDPVLGRAWGAFPIVSPQKAPGFLWFLGLNDTFFMSLLFLLSGVYVARSLGRRGPAGFARARLWRLGVPFALSAVFLAPLAYAPAYIQITGGGSAGDFLGRWFGAANLTAGPAWFLWLLLAFDLVAALLSMAWKDWPDALRRLLPRGDRPALFFGLLLLLSALAYIPLAAVFGSAHWTALGAFQVQTSRLAHYALYFTVGVCLGRQGDHETLLAPDGPLARNWWVWALAAVLAPVVGAAAVIGSSAPGLTMPARETIGGVGFVYDCAALCFVFLAVFLRFVRRANPVMDSLRDNSYGIYLVHYVFVNWLNHALLGPQLPAVAKFAIAVVGAAALSWITAALLRRLVGLTPPRRDQPPAPKLASAA